MFYKEVFMEVFYESVYGSVLWKVFYGEVFYGKPFADGRSGLLPQTSMLVLCSAALQYFHPFHENRLLWLLCLGSGIPKLKWLFGS